MGAPGPRLIAADAVVDPPDGRAAAAAVRLAVRADLGDLGDPSVAVAVSGGRDSLALLHATTAVAAPLGVRVAALTVDHGWHPDSAAVAAAVADAARRAGCDPVEVLDAADAGTGPGGGPEAEARRARYTVLEAAAHRLGVGAVLLGHTLDDQAETVLLALARGSGARSLAGMPARRGPFRRPLLGVRRAVVHAALDDLAATLPAGLPWEDPANTDRRLTRARVRADLLPLIETVLGPGAVAALARSAALLRQDADALDALAARAVAEMPADPLPVTALAALPDALLARAVRLLAARAGAGALTAAHTRSLVDLVRARSGSGAGPVALPGGVAARRERGSLLLGPATSASAAPAGQGEEH